MCWVALISMLASLLNWGLSLVFGGLLVRALARRTELKMDYRAAGAAAYLGLGAVWALGLSSSAAQLQAQPGQPATVDPVDYRGDPVHRDPSSSGSPA
ncbi:short-chain fatty acid transporter [Pseudomonas putida S11]|nr:short-chain fatty acid transporter [Pseudomonas putida S11]